MATNVTLSCTVNDENKGAAAAILSNALDQLVSVVPELDSISLSIFTDDFAAAGEDADTDAAARGEQ